METSREDGVAAVTLARAAIESHLSGAAFRPPTEAIPPSLRSEGGVFVTLTTHPEGELRGCIGFPEPVLPRIEALLDAAVSAAIDDPRFAPLRREELRAVRIEVTLLSVPELLIGAPAQSTRGSLDRPLLEESQRERLPSLVRIGTDGLIVEHDGRRGLLLPQVAPEQGWDATELLEGTCRKAGLRIDAWRSPRCVLWRFGGDIYGEEAPGGAVRPIVNAH